MRKLRQFFPFHIQYILIVYLIGILFFTIFRSILFYVNIKQVNSIPAERVYVMIQAFVMGLRFDTVISGYILLLPLVILSIVSVFLKPEHNPFTRFYLAAFLNIFIGILYTIAFLMCTIDIPFYKQFYTRLNSMALAWMDTPGFVFKMIFQEYTYWIFLIPFFLILGLFWWFILRVLKGTLNKANISADNVLYRPKTIVLSIFMLGFMFIGIRGRLEQKSPIRVGTAFFSPYAFPNQLGLNPVFTFLRSWLDDQDPKNRSLRLMDSQAALLNTRKFLLSANAGEAFPDTTPVARNVTFNDPPVQANVVIIIMESMGAAKLGHFGNTDHLTPFLDSLANVSLSFENAYSAGIHTSNGIFSTLTGLPALGKQHPMNRFPILKYSGISNTLKKHGYQTLFAITHDDQFDNIGGFMHANDFDEVVSQQNYPSSKVLSTLGVPDHYMFEYVMPKLNIMHYNNRPFLAAFMTASDHGPYIVPRDIPFKPVSKDERKATTEYADWSIRHFFDMAKKQPWFNNTIFVLVADHGFAEGGIYDMPLTYHHTPLLFFAPGIIRDMREIQSLAGQIDIFPTIMGILRQPYVNNTMGIDLLKEKRPYIYFSADDKFGCLDSEYFLVIRDDGSPSLYDYVLKDTYNYLPANAKLARNMKTYMFSMLQTTQYMVDNQLVESYGLPPDPK